MNTGPEGYRAGEFVGRCDDIPVLHESKHHAVDDFMPEAWSWEMLSWGQENFGLLNKTGNPLSYQSSSALNVLERHCPEVRLLLDSIVGELPDATAACDVELPTEPVFVEAWLSHRGEGDHFHWHTDRDPLPPVAQTRVLAFCYYMHSIPCHFMGGELEFFDGVLVTPKHNRLVLFNPHMMHRVRHVHGVPRGWGGSDMAGKPPAEWPDVEPLHYVDGRWDVLGWIHTKEPEYDLGY